MLIPLILRITIYVITIIHDDISSDFIFHSVDISVAKDGMRHAMSAVVLPHLTRDDPIVVVVVVVAAAI